MRTIQAFVVGLCIAGACASFTPTASAQAIPPLCTSPREVRQFLVGVRAGRNLAQQAIAAVEADSDEDDLCQDLEALADLRNLIQAIVDGLVVDPPSPTAQCRLQGQVIGLVAEVVDLQDVCVDVCIADGRFIGEVTAELYCALSIALDGLGLAELFERLATTECGEAFQDACDAKFAEVATADLECLPFTIDDPVTGNFEEVFLTAQNNQCAADPED